MSLRTNAVAAGRFQEERVGSRPFVAVAVAVAVLVPIHLYLRTLGWGGGLLLVALDLIWIVLLVFLISERRSQARFGLGHVRLDALSYNLGQPLVLHVGSERGLGGLHAIEVRVRSVDAVYEMRDTGRGAERERVCYYVWQDEQRRDAKDIPPTGEARCQLDLPAAGTFADAVGDHIERYWEVEVTRYGRLRPCGSACSCTRRRPAIAEPSWDTRQRERRFASPLALLSSSAQRA